MTHILVAEDNPALGAVVKFNLQHAGFEVTLARNGREAAQYLEQQAFDLLVTDEQMPEMSGRELCTWLAGQPNHIGMPIIMLTAKSLELEGTALRQQLGVCQLMGKPFSPRELVDTAREWIQTPAAV